MLIDSGEADGFLFCVMPYVEGPSIRDKLAKDGELPIGDAGRILRDVVDALTEAHAHRVVHRDIKPTGFKSDATRLRLAALRPNPT